MGIVSRIDVMRRLNPEIESEEEALERLLRIRTMQRDLDRLAADEGLKEKEEPEEEPEEEIVPEEPDEKEDENE